MDLLHRPPDKFTVEKPLQRTKLWTISAWKALAFLGLALFAGGCAQDAEERAFFNSGWLSPEAGANRRLGAERQ